MGNSCNLSLKSIQHFYGMGECDGDNGDGDDNYAAAADFKGNK